MGKRYAYTSFLVILCVTSCLESHQPLKRRPPVTGARIVEIRVDDTYDFSHTIAVTIFDSISLSKENLLYVPEDFTSEIYFLDNHSMEVLAVLKPDSTEKIQSLNAENIARAIMDLAPAYTSLTVKDQQEVQQMLPVEPAFKELVHVVDGFLKRNKSVYGEDAELNNAIIKVNDLIAEWYFSTEGGRTTSDEELRNWISNSSRGGVIVSQVSSFSEVALKSTGKSEERILLNPAPLYFGTTEISLPLPDNNYLLQITQEPKHIVERNVVQLANQLFNTFITAVYGAAKIDAGCQSAIVASVAQKISSMAITGSVNTVEQNTKSILSAALQVLKEALSNKACQKSIMENGASLLLAVGKKLNAAANVVLIANTVVSLGESTPLLLAIVDPINISDSIQLYNGSIIPGIIEFVSAYQVPKSSAPGETVRVGVKAKVKSSFDDVSTFPFQINWKVINGYGYVSQQTSTVKANSISAVYWVLPSNASGTFQAQADIKGGSGRHLRNSPIVFETIVEGSLEALLIDNSPWKLTSFVFDGEELFYYDDDCQATDHDCHCFKERLIEGTFTFNTGQAAIQMKEENAFYNCDTRSFDITHDLYTLSHEWVIDKASGKLVMTYVSSEINGEEDDEADIGWDAWLTPSVSDNRNKVTFNGIFKQKQEDGGQSEGSITIEKR